jgi:phenylacetate-CoA ligase
MRDVDSRSHLSHAATMAFRDRRLRAFVHHAVETVPFYRDMFRELRISPNDVMTIADLKVLPVLSKREVQNEPSRFSSSSIPARGWLRMHTSGTTGAGLRFFATPEAVREQWAVWWRYRAWHGLTPSVWCGYFGGRSIVPLAQVDPPYWRLNYAGKQIMFSAYHLNDRTAEAYVNQLRHRKPQWLHGYPSMLTLLAAYLLDSGRTLGYEVKWITTGAENLLDQQANLIERAFGVSPRQHYGMAEAVANFSECTLGRLHVDEDFAAVEFVPTGSDNTYRVIGTNFTNPATPLLRYDVQDVVEIDHQRCHCGLPGRIVKRVDGRLEDYVVLKNGSRIGRLDHIFKDLTSIREAQIIQNAPGAVTIRVVGGSNYGADAERLLLREVRTRLGEDTHVALEYVTAIERSRTGKLRFVRSFVSDKVSPVAEVSSIVD